MEKEEVCTFLVIGRWVAVGVLISVPKAIGITSEMKDLCRGDLWENSRADQCKPEIKGRGLHLLQSSHKRFQG